MNKDLKIIRSFRRREEASFSGTCEKIHVPCHQKKMIEIHSTFDEEGWLTIGFCGNQPDLGESYISTGSLYLCSTVFLPLGLDRDDQFWSMDARECTSQKIWAGKNQERDQALTF